MYQRLRNREDVDKEHVIELQGGNTKMFFLKKDSKTDALEKVKIMLLYSYENRLYKA